MPSGRAAGQRGKARGNRTVNTSSRVLRSSNRTVLEQVPEDDTAEVVLDRRANAVPGSRPFNGRPVGRRPTRASNANGGAIPPATQTTARREGPLNNNIAVGNASNAMPVFLSTLLENQLFQRNTMPHYGSRHAFPDNGSFQGLSQHLDIAQRGSFSNIMSHYVPPWRSIHDMDIQEEMNDVQSELFDSRGDSLMPSDVQATRNAGQSGDSVPTFSTWSASSARHNFPSLQMGIRARPSAQRASRLPPRSPSIAMSGDPTPRERRYPQRSNHRAVLDRINVALHGTRNGGVARTRIRASLRTTVSPRSLRTTAQMTTGRAAPRLNASRSRAELRRIAAFQRASDAINEDRQYLAMRNRISFLRDFSTPPSDVSSSDTLHSAAISFRRFRDIIGAEARRSDLNSLYGMQDLIHTDNNDIFDDFLERRNRGGEVVDFPLGDLLRRAMHEEEGGYPPSRIFHTDVDPFETPSPLPKPLGNIGGQCLICFEDDVQDAVYCMHCYQQVGCFSCLLRWVQTNSIVIHVGVRYVPNPDHLTCPLCRHAWDTARPEVFRNTTIKKESVSEPLR